MGGDILDDMGPDMMVEDETPDIISEDETPDVSVDDSSSDASTASDSTPDDSSTDQSEVDASIDLVSPPPAPTSGKNEGCAQSSTNNPSPTNMLFGGLGLLGLFGLRRRT
jgi:MYXO-CTERM domain-containing protein